MYVRVSVLYFNKMSLFCAEHVNPLFERAGHDDGGRGTVECLCQEADRTQRPLPALQKEEGGRRVLRATPGRTHRKHS